jgi:hypothetical protein
MVSSTGLVDWGGAAGLPNSIWRFDWFELHVIEVVQDFLVLNRPFVKVASPELAASSPHKPSVLNLSPFPTRAFD